MLNEKLRGNASLSSSHLPIILIGIIFFPILTTSSFLTSFYLIYREFSTTKDRFYQKKDNSFRVMNILLEFVLK